jgi:GntR family transcriptional repressor for pyruvate dehydrogenase complex
MPGGVSEGGGPMFKPVQGAKLYELVIEQIESRILQGVYKPGDMLPSEKDLMTGMGVSRITVREALRILGSAGVIETMQGKGSRVLMDGFTLARQRKEQFKSYRDRFIQTTRARLMIEPEAARYAASAASPPDIERIQSAVCSGPLPGGRAVLADDSAAANFHKAIIETTGNSYLIEFFDSLLDMEMLPKGSTLITPALRSDVFSQFNEQHRKIAEAIGNHDGEFAYFYMKEHTLFVERLYLEYFSRFTGMDETS